MDLGGKRPYERYLASVSDAIRDSLAPELSSPFARAMSDLAGLVLARVRTDLEQAEPGEGEAEVSDRIRALRRDGNTNGEAFTRIVRDAATRTLAREQALTSTADGASKVMPAPLAERVATYFRLRFPEANGLQVANVQVIPGGRSKSTILVDLERAGTLPDSVVIRLDIPAAGLRTSVVDEFPLLKLAHGKGLPVPEPLLLEADEAPLGAPFILVRRMPGKAAAHTMFDMTGVTPELAQHLAALLASVHALDPSTAWPTAPSDAQGCTAALFADFEQRWNEASVFRPSVVVEAAFARLESGLKDVSGPAVIVHGDPSFQNLLVQDHAITGLLDWEFAHPGDPAEDLAYVRNAVESVIPWKSFMDIYSEHGGPAVADDRISLFEIWASLRNLVFASNVLASFERGDRRDIQSAAIAINTFPKLEAQLAQRLANG